MIERPLACLCLCLTLAGCASQPEPPPLDAPQGLAPATDAGDALDPARDGPTDPWFDSLGAWFGPEERRAYLATPVPERFERWGARLLDFRLREDAIEGARDVLGSEDLERARKLGSLDAVKAFVEERTRRAAQAPPSDERGAPDEGPAPSPTVAPGPTPRALSRSSTPARSRP